MVRLAIVQVAACGRARRGRLVDVLEACVLGAGGDGDGGAQGGDEKRKELKAAMKELKAAMKELKAEMKELKEETSGGARGAFGRGGG